MPKIAHPASARSGVAFLVVCLLAYGSSGAAETRPPLRDVPRIDNSMLATALAIETARICPSLGLKKVNGIKFLWSVNAQAKKLGYSDSEIKAYVNSGQEKARIRKRGEAFVREQGFDPHTEEGICGFGRWEIGGRTLVGSFLRRE